MSSNLSPEAAHAAWDAERHILRLDAQEWLAQFHDQETSRILQHSFAARYRCAVGVHPDQRHEFRDALMRIRDGGGAPVETVIAVLNAQETGISSPAGTPQE